MLGVMDFDLIASFMAVTALAVGAATLMSVLETKAKITRWKTLFSKKVDDTITEEETKELEEIELWLN